MMTAEQLKVSILQLAIGGKLVEHRIEEGTGQDVLREISTERQCLFKTGKIRKEVLPSIEDNEKQFDLPETWGQIRLGDLVSKTIKRGKSPKYVDLSNILVFAQKCNVKKGGIDLGLAKYLDPGKFLSYPEDECMIDRDIVVNSTGNGTLGRVGIFRDDDNPRKLKVVPDSHVTVIRVCHAMSVEYIYYFLKANQLFLEKLGEGSTNQTELRPDILKMLVVPIPPLREQYRIVKKIEELLPFVDQYATVSENLDKLNSEFPDQVKKSILQLAVEGKLVEQRPEEGTGEELFRKIQEEKTKLIKEGKIKKQKPLAEITDDEKPFDIPDSWTWIRLKDLGEFSSGKTPSMSDVRNWQNGRVSWITSKDMKNKYLSISQMLISEYAASEMRLYPPNTMLMVVRSGILKRMLPVSILTANSTINQDIKAFSLYYPDICEYIYVVLKGMETYILQTYRKQVTTVDSLRFEDFQNMPIPIPPEQEQRRIILKLNTILPEIEQLNK